MEIDAKIHELLLKKLPRGKTGKNIKAVAGWFTDRDEGMVSHGDFDRVKPGEAYFQIGSVTKLFTASLAEICRQSGQLDMNKKVSDYLQLDTASRVGSILIEDLLTHHSGLPSAPRALFRGYDRQNPYAAISKEKLISYLNTYGKPMKPKRQFLYSNLGYGMMGLILESATGETYEKLVADRICSPLGLRDTWIPPPAFADDRLVEGTAKGGKKTPRWVLNALEPAGAVDSNMHDMLKFARANLKGHDFYPKVELCHHARRPVHKHLSIGLGWFITEHKNLGVLHSHNGGTGGFNSFLGIHPEKRFGIAVLINRGISLATELGFQQDAASYMGYRGLQHLSEITRVRDERGKKN